MGLTWGSVMGEEVTDVLLVDPASRPGHFQDLFYAGRHPSRLPRAQMVCEDLPVCMAPRTEHFCVWALRPLPEAFPEPPVFRGPLKMQDPGIYSHSVVPLKERRRAQITRMTHRILDDRDTDTSGCFHESRPAHKMHVGCLAEWGDVVTRDPKSLPVYHGTADVLACFRCLLGCLVDTDHRCFFEGCAALYLVSAPDW